MIGWVGRQVDRALLVSLVVGWVLDPVESEAVNAADGLW